MADRVLPSIVVAAIVAAAAGAGITAYVMRSPAEAQTAGTTTTPARVDGKPNFSGIWQANNEANWDLQAHAARPAAVT